MQRRPGSKVKITLLLPLAALALFTSRAASADGAQFFGAFIKMLTGDSFEGQTLAEIEYPMVPGICGGSRASITMIAGFSGEPDPMFSHCEGDLSNPRPICEAADSEILFDVNDPGVSCSSGDCTWSSIAASADEATCGGYRGAAVLGNLFPPAEQKVVTFEAGGLVAVVAAEGDALPDGGGATITTLGATAVAGDKVFFAASGTGGRSGLYVYNAVGGTITTIADDQDPRPRSPGNFDGATSVDAVVTPGGVEVAWSDGVGVYVAPADLSSLPTQPIAQGDPYAAGRNVRGPFNQVSFWPGTDRVVAQGYSQTFAGGIYSASESAPGVVARHADNETPVPGGTGTFSTSQNPSAAGDTLFFEGFDGVFLGVYGDTDLADGPVQPVLLRNDSFPIPGVGVKTVQSPATSKRSVYASGRAILLVYFTDATAGIVGLQKVLLVAGFNGGDFAEWSSHVP